MSVCKPIVVILVLVIVTLMNAVGLLSAADISYVGFETNIEAVADSPTNGWRNATPAKPLDLDGDHVLGTDGYSLPWSGVESLPSYIGSVTRLAPNENGGTHWGRMDHPADPSGTDTVGMGMWFGSDDLVEFVITGGDLSGKTLRLGVLVGGYGSVWQYGLQLTQTVGGSVVVTSGGALTGDHADGLDVVYFDLRGVSDGDTFKVSIVDYLSAGYKHASGLCFDSKSPSGTLLILR